MLQVVRLNATGRDVEFHYWNSLSSLVREVISLYGLIELGSIFVAILLEVGGHGL